MSSDGLEPPRPAPRLATPLTDAQRLVIEQRLLDERRRLLRALARFTRRLDPADDDADAAGRMPQHMAELGTATMQETFDATMASRETHLLGEVDDALRRLYRQPHTFGLDEQTGELIPFERLEILPWARRAVGR